MCGSSKLNTLAYTLQSLAVEPLAQLQYSDSESDSSQFLIIMHLKFLWQGSLNILIMYCTFKQATNAP